MLGILLTYFPYLLHFCLQDARWSLQCFNTTKLKIVEPTQVFSSIPHTQFRGTMTPTPALLSSLISHRRFSYLCHDTAFGVTYHFPSDTALANSLQNQVLSCFLLTTNLITNCFTVTRRSAVGGPKLCAVSSRATKTILEPTDIIR